MKRRYFYPKTVNAVQLINERKYYDIETVIKNRFHSAPQFIKRLELECELDGHTGCVNCLEWSDNGSLLASASDDYHVLIWDAFRHKILTKLTTPHRGNIFSVKFMPKTGNSTVITGAADSKIYVYDLNRKDAPTWKCQCHTMRVKRIATAPETPFLFWSAGEDGYVLQFDMRQPHTCGQDGKVMLINLTNHLGDYAEAKCLAVNPRRPELIAVGANDCFARVYDVRMITLDKIKPIDDLRNGRMILQDNIPKGCVTYYCPGHLSSKPKTITHRAATYITFSPDGTELLVNMGAEQIYLYDINNSKEPEFLNLPNYKKCEDGEDTTTTTKREIPESIEYQKKLGNDFLENKKYLQAIYQYTIAIKKAPDCPVLYLNRATALMRRGWYGDVYAAIKDCHTALKLDPSYIKAHFRLARALLELQHLKEANVCLEELKKRFPNYSNNHGVMMLRKDIDTALDNKNNAVGCRTRPPNNSPNEQYWKSVAMDYKERFVGHCNTTTDIKEANFFGNDSNYIIAGSDDGNFFIWERPTNIITEVFNGDKSIVNCVQPHPYICLLATSGIDHEVRLWSPQPEENYISKHRTEYLDVTVDINQQRMQCDPFDLEGPEEAFCRPS